MSGGWPVSISGTLVDSSIGCGVGYGRMVLFGIFKCAQTGVRSCPRFISWGIAIHANIPTIENTQSNVPWSGGRAGPGGVAQSVEQRPFKPWVLGSSPSTLIGAESGKGDQVAGLRAEGNNAKIPALISSKRFYTQHPPGARIPLPGLARVMVGSGRVSRGTSRRPWIDGFWIIRCSNRRPPGVRDPARDRRDP